MFGLWTNEFLKRSTQRPLLLNFKHDLLDGSSQEDSKSLFSYKFYVTYKKNRQYMKEKNMSVGCEDQINSLPSTANEIHIPVKSWSGRQYSTVPA